jgi:hypothetical protein
MFRVLISSLAIVCCTSSAIAKEVPAFLESKVYSTDPSKCGDVTEDNSLQLSKEGIFGLEFGCTFLGFELDKDKDTGETYLAIARANCGDDSGINRPDNITLIAQGDDIITVQSQNEYIVSEAQILLSQRLPENIQLAEEFPSYVSRDYKICK